MFHKKPRPRHGRYRQRALVRVARPYLRRLPGLPPGPDFLSQALKAYSKAIHCHRRLAKLAPEFFDSAVVDRLAREREERCRWMESWEAALEKVYGPSTTLKPHESPFPALPGPRTCRAVDRELTALRGWLDMAHDAMHLYHQQRFHPLPPLGRIVRMVQVGFELARLASGFTKGLPEPPLPKPDPEVDLRRACQNRPGIGTQPGNA